MKTKKSVSLLSGKNILSWLLYGGLAVLVALMQNAPRVFPVIQYARPAPLILLVVCIAFFEGPRIGAVFGVIAGLLWDLYTFHLFGLHALIFLIIAVAVGLLVQWLLRANFLSGMLLCVGGVLVHVLLEWLLCYVLFLDSESISALVHIYLPNALYTVVLSPVVYGVVLLTARFLRKRQKR